MNEKILSDIQEFIEGVGQDISPITADKWLLASSLQKAIRRGDVDIALKAGKGLWLVDRQSFWRRVYTTALEDIGIGDLDTVTLCLQVTLARSWRDKAWDLAAGLYLVQCLCRCVKSRMADEVYLLIERASQYQNLRMELIHNSEDHLVKLIMGYDTLQTKALALWCLSGTERLPSDYFPKRKGNKDKVIGVLKCFNVPQNLTQAILGVLYKTQWPLALFTPLIVQEAAKEETSVEIRSLSKTIITDGLPHYGVDQYTRLGKTCIRGWMAEVKGLKSFSTSQVGMALFYLEGALIDKTLHSLMLENINQSSEFAMMGSLGLSDPEYLALREILKDNLGKLEDIRARHIKHYMEDFKEGLI